MTDREKLSESKLKALYTTFLYNPLRHIGSGFTKTPTQAACKRKQQQGLELQDPKPSKRQKSFKKERPKQGPPAQKQIQRLQAQSTSKGPRKQPESGARHARGGGASQKRLMVQQDGNSGKAGAKQVSQPVRVKRTYGRTLLTRRSTSLRPSPAKLGRAQADERDIALQGVASGKKPFNPASKQLPASSSKLPASDSLPGRGRSSSLGDTLPKPLPNLDMIGNKPGTGQPAIRQGKAEPGSVNHTSRQAAKAAGQAVPSEQALQGCLRSYSEGRLDLQPDPDDSAQGPASHWQTLLQQTREPTDRARAKTKPTGPKKPSPPDTPPPSSQGRAAENWDAACHSNLSDSQKAASSKADSKAQASPDSGGEAALEGACQTQRQTRKRRAFLAARESIANRLGRGADGVIQEDEAGDKGTKASQRFLAAVANSTDRSKPVTPASAAEGQAASLEQSSQPTTEAAPAKCKPVSDKLLAVLGLPNPRQARLQGKKKARNPLEASCKPSELARPAKLRYPPLPYSRWELEATKEPQHTPRIADHRHSHLPKRARKDSRDSRNDSPRDEQKGESTITAPIPLQSRSVFSF